MKQNTLTIIFAVLSLCGVIYWIATADLVNRSSELDEFDAKIMQLQEEIDKAQEEYLACEAIMANSHDKAEANRKAIENLQKEKADLVGLSQETLQSQRKK